jgi:hypothetical protein
MALAFDRPRPLPAESAVREGSIDLVEPFEDVGDVFRSDALARIGDRQYGDARAHFCAQLDRAPWGVCRSALANRFSSRTISGIRSVSMNPHIAVGDFNSCETSASIWRRSRSDVFKVSSWATSSSAMRLKARATLPISSSPSWRARAERSPFPGRPAASSSAVAHPRGGGAERFFGKVTQIAFPESANAAVYATGVYAFSRREPYLQLARQYLCRQPRFGAGSHFG